MTANSMVVYLNSTTLIITLNVNDLNPTQRQTVFFKDPTIHCFKKIYYKNIDRSKVKETHTTAKTRHKEAVVVTLISNSTNIKQD